MALVPVLYLALAAQSIPAADDAGTLDVSDTATRPPGAIPAKVSFAKLVLRSNGRGAQLRSGT